jgi:hypothetical protein
LYRPPYIAQHRFGRVENDGVYLFSKMDVVG